jgi:hypothetical protein
MTLIAYLFASTATILWAASGVYLFSAVAFQESPKSKEAFQAEYPTKMKPVLNDRLKTGDGETRQSSSQFTESGGKVTEPILTDRPHGGAVAATLSLQSNAKVATSQTGLALDRDIATRPASGQAQPSPLPTYPRQEATPAATSSDAASLRPDATSAAAAVDERRSAANDDQRTEPSSISARLASAGAPPPSFSAAVPPPHQPGFAPDEGGPAAEQAQTSATTMAAPIQAPVTALSSASDILDGASQPSAGLSARGPTEVVSQPPTTASISTQDRPRVAGSSAPAADSTGPSLTNHGAAAVVDGFDQPAALGGARRPAEIERNRLTAGNPFGHIKRKVAHKAPRAKETSVGVVTPNRSDVDDAEIAPPLEDEVDKAGPPTELVPRWDHPALSKPGLKRRCPAVLRASDDFSEELVELCRNWARRSVNE